jgi:hypothetical protein
MVRVHIANYNGGEHTNAKANVLVKTGASNDQRWVNLQTVGAKRGARKVLAKLWPKEKEI